MACFPIRLKSLSEGDPLHGAAVAGGPGWVKYLLIYATLAENQQNRVKS